MLFKRNQIVAMVIVFAGHLPQQSTLGTRELAESILDQAHGQGVPAQYQLSPYAVIKVERANEMEDEPDNDYLSAMLKSCRTQIGSIDVDFTGQSGLVPMKELHFKTWSSIVSTTWVGLQVAQSDFATTPPSVAATPAPKTAIQPSASAPAPKTAVQPSTYTQARAVQETCKRCGQTKEPGALACPQCGRIEWGILGFLGGFSAVVALIGVIWGSSIASRFWSAVVTWGGVGLGGLLLALTIGLIVYALKQSARASKKVSSR